MQAVSSATMSTSASLSAVSRPSRRLCPGLCRGCRGARSVWRDLDRPSEAFAFVPSASRVGDPTMQAVSSATMSTTASLSAVSRPSRGLCPRSRRRCRGARSVWRHLDPHSEAFAFDHRASQVGAPTMRMVPSTTGTTSASLSAVSRPSPRLCPGWCRACRGAR